MKRVAISLSVAFFLVVTACGKGPVALSASPAEVEFGLVSLGSYIRRTVVLTAGSGAVVLGRPVLDGDDTSILLGPIEGPLEAGTTRALEIVWAPYAIGPLDHWITLPSDATGNDLRIHLSGTTAACGDADGDQHGVGTTCSGPTDCNDSDRSVHPGAEERCDGRDNDCDGVIDEDGVCGGSAAELCNGIDDDGNGVVDDVLGRGETCAIPGRSGAGLDCTNSGRRTCDLQARELTCQPAVGSIDCTGRCDAAPVMVSIVPYFAGERRGMAFQNPAGSGISAAITVRFEPPVPTVSFTCVDCDFPENMAIAYDTTGNVLDRVSFIVDGDPATSNTDVQTLTSRTGRPIARVALLPDPRDAVGYGTIELCPR